ncbi:hypothetical protein KPH14_012491 [Odynerus spinipes]|uniref:Protein kinase domain-containing protein n=1 Tax=Odynerus spinipes TaxID=1348599 RepID=A0AAD9VNE4_9HYME|nr:hypothetical protein KPH14_012491 [Odynerus spinipes]
MGMMGVFKWLRKDIGYRDRNGRSLSARQCALSNESYRNALQAFIDRRRFSTTVLETTSRSSTDIKSVSLLTDRSNDNDNESEIKDEISWMRPTNEFVVLDVPRVPASEIFEIGWVAGTEDRYLELVYAEWENTRISLKRHTHPDCRNAVKADMEVLTKIRHPNVLMLMAMTQTEDHGLVSILEPVDCTLYNYIHEQGERISVREIARFAGKLADALRHAHMRGYVHSAISSHCVYLASGETVKLGGWELSVSTTNSNPKREYEERLRAEIFRWQAPELFSGKSCKESDIYGLALLIWEMCTTRIPWNGCSISDLEKQYTQVKRGIAINLCDFPPLINNLLEAGLQFDVAQRSLDINRIRRLLQNLEIQYESKDPVYADELTSNNNEVAKTFVVPIAEPVTATSYRNVGSQANGLTKLLCYPKSDTTSISTETCDSEIVAIAQSTSISHITHNDRPNLCDDLEEKKLHSVDRQRRKVSVPHSVEKKSHKLISTASGLPSNTLKNSEHATRYVPWNCTYRKVKLSKDLSESDYSSVSAASSRVTNSVDDEIIITGSARKNIQRLKEAIASRRERFFYGTDSPVQDASLRTKDKLLSEVKSKDYEPHKPASHKTCLEPKYNKSPGQYDSSYISKQTNRKVPYSQMPAHVKSAIMQPRVLNSDPQNFFESSLWKKEKEICISKMRKEDKNETLTSTEDTENLSMPLDVPERDGTFTVKTKSLESIDTMQKYQSDRLHAENILESERRHSTNNNSLQVLKDALDRATEIICSTSHTDMIPSCIPPQPCDSFNNTTNDIETSESIFEKIYSLTSKDGADEIRSIERTDNINGTFLLNKNITADTEMLEKDGDFKSELNEFTFSREHTNKTAPIGAVKRFSESDNFEESMRDKNKKESTENIDLNKFFLPTISGEKNDFESNISFLLSRDKNCKTCNNKITLPRRRSLPAALCHLKVGNNSTLGRLPIRKADNNAENSVEDFYIDDDDLEMMNLNINMLLLNEEVNFDDLLFEEQTT